MKYVAFGKTGIRVSELCLGTMTFGNEADEDASRGMMDRAFERGVNFFDTADVYTAGATEEIVGRWLKGRRKEIVLATKVHYPTGKGVNERGSSRLHILQGVENSLRRLQTDYLDLLYLHHWDDETPIEESLSAVDHLVHQGKVLYCGVSNFSAWQTMKSVDCAQAMHFAPVAAVQPMYNLVKRVAEVEILPMAVSEGLAVCPYSPLAAGLLTGKYHRGERGRISNHPMYRERYKDPAYMESAGHFVDYAKSLGLAPASLAVAWVLSHPGVTSPIIGARNLEQLELALAGGEIELSEGARTAVRPHFPGPPRATEDAS
ncbi:MAG: aldo/keto reductase [Planctomycetia bacterium]|nr:aldo/keto reductase [Planctomycetia bacterium]